MNSCEWYPETVLHNREDQFVPQSGPIVLPLECPDVAIQAVERVGFQNFVVEEAGFEEGNCLALPVLLV